MIDQSGIFQFSFRFKLKKKKKIGIPISALRAISEENLNAYSSF